MLASFGYHISIAATAAAAVGAADAAAVSTLLFTVFMNCGLVTMFANQAAAAGT